MPNEKSSQRKALAKLGIGPMSSDIIEAVFCYSDTRKTPLMLIPSKNQIDVNGGYVNNWNTSQFMGFIGQMKKQYPVSQVYVCRDHCGPGFSGSDSLEGVQETIDSDIENGFDLIHVDFSKLKGEHQEILQASAKAILRIKNKNPRVLIEVGTDENVGAFLTDIERIEKEMQFFTSITDIQFFVCQTGSLIKEINQRGDFNAEFLEKVNFLADKYQVCLKEHNADYLSDSAIKKRVGLIGAVNVAPQYGVLQTMLTLQKCLLYGFDFSDFLNQAYESQKWLKWLDQHTKENKFLCSVIAGHYVFASSAYKKLYEQINQRENFKEAIMAEMMKNFDLYLNNL